MLQHARLPRCQVVQEGGRPLQNSEVVMLQEGRHASRPRLPTLRRVVREGPSRRTGPRLPEHPTDLLFQVDKYCDSCGGPRGCGKAACLTKLPVPTPLPTETVVAPCETTTTTTPLTTTSKAAPPTTTTTVPAVPVPTGPGICKQPSNKLCGYRPGHPLGGIGLPALTCNNLAADFHAGNALKLYTEQDSARCPSFPKHESPVACAHACAAQFEECLAVYVPGVKHQGRFGSKTYGLGLNLGLGLDLGLDWVQAKACCSLQLLDCKAANLRPVVDGCHKFGDWV